MKPNNNAFTRVVFVLDAVSIRFGTSMDDNISFPFKDFIPPQRLRSPTIGEMAMQIVTNVVLSRPAFQ